MAIETQQQTTKRCAHAHHVGSLLRPPRLVQKRIAFHSDKCTAEELKALEDEVLPEFVKLQKEVGMGVITDGEVHRAMYTHGIYEALEGMTITERPMNEFMPYLPYLQPFKAMGIERWTSIYCTGKIRRTKPVYADDFLALKALVSPEDVPDLKITICGPAWMHLTHGSEYAYDHSVYQNDEEYFADLVTAFREEIQGLYELGCRRIQFDDPGFCFFCSEMVISAMDANGVDHEKLLNKHISVYNAITANRPADLIIAVHSCRGNMKGLHFVEGGYERVARKLFCEVDVDVYYLEYDTDRAGGLEPLRYLPPGKHVVLGLVTTKRGALESIETIKERVRRASEIIAEGEPRRSVQAALEQLSISPQCGFASVFEGNPITEEEQKQKLALVVEAARAIWG
ncbi:UROD/MetE-like protein [Pilatotrama ljubarskyi]|nr:UROD/MetE-like protein [Pilatotrama ljubarskyi]